MLGGANVPGNLPAEITGIPLGVKADALFFLHTARLDQRMNDRDRAENKRYELCRYVIHYADGQTTEVPILAEVDIDHFVQQKPASLPGAQLAWSAPFENSDDQAAAYSKQWNNPRPDVAIESIDLVPGKDKDRGVPVLISVTAATAK
jgi:beta-galactosidase